MILSHASRTAERATATVMPVTQQRPDRLTVIAAFRLPFFTGHRKGMKYHVFHG
ncbi:MAG: hypothetical protein JXA71_04335 [Chitinispirillaceae bacterium]|nr:hypothetical protein [Chitinispirillaceae bacterium]